MGNLGGKIEHVVVLMMENRSFDSILGQLYPGNPGFDGLTGNETNPNHGKDDVKVWNSGNVDQKSMSIPDPDPGELWNDINMQLFGLDGKPGSETPAMNGFVNNYVRQTADASGNYSPESIMHYYTPEQLPVISTLAKQFAVCDNWFASAPCQTWPNRFFLHCATAEGYENNSPARFPYLMETVFNRFSNPDAWKIYFHDFPQTLTLSRLWPHIDRFRLFETEFAKDVAAGKLPSYTFIEPRYFPDVKLPNDQHPPHHVGMGEDLIAEVYNALRGAPTWEKTLLVIVYDEHGGNYDHVPPPKAVPPDNSHSQPFGFDRYGVRVPAVLVSPYIKAGTILKTPEGSSFPFDHTSVIATLRKCFALGAPISHRDAVAPDLECVLNLDTPSNLGPDKVVPLPYAVSPDELVKALNAPLNDFQKAMHEAAAHLPIRGGINILDDIENHVENLVKGIIPEVPDHRTAAAAMPFISEKLRTFLGNVAK
ncbi:phospholipase C [Methylobacter tundripaludum]|uniref:Phospholipase C n=1 Tax=Methylobacter tundripaludum TaxID=173365 RepID=A0A2S6H7I5_9GAMM|nr:alkaline phosphatase family protein [Methylobacter tundripaludum]PPK73444.1 phospholipase C [Methylobacter tundripaludum]